MTVSEILTIIGFVVSITIALIGAMPEIKRIRNRRKVDQTESADAAFELAEKYGKKVLELEARITHTEEVLGGNLHLNMEIPMIPLMKDGSTTFTGVARLIKKEELKTP